MRAIAQRPDIRDLILDGVDALLARFGYRKMTMDDLARQVGIGKGTIYLHFSGKEEVTLAHIDRIAGRVLNEMRRIADSDGSAEDRLREMLRARVLVRFDSVTGYSESLNDLLVSLRKDLLARREMYFDKERKALEDVLLEGQKSGMFRFQNVVETSKAILWSTNSLLPYSLTARELGKRKEIDELVLRIADLLLNGIRIPASRMRKS